MLSQRFVSLLPTSFVLLQKRKRELAPGYIWMDEETGVFLSLMQGDKTTIGYEAKKLKNKKKEMPRTKLKAIVGIEEIAGLMKGLRSARQQSPFFTMVIRDEWLVSFDYAIVIHSIHSMLKNSIHSIQKLINGPNDWFSQSMRMLKAPQNAWQVLRGSLTRRSSDSSVFVWDWNVSKLEVASIDEFRIFLFRHSMPFFVYPLSRETRSRETRLPQTALNLVFEWSWPGHVFTIVSHTPADDASDPQTFHPNCVRRLQW